MVCLAAVRKKRAYTLTLFVTYCLFPFLGLHFSLANVTLKLRNGLFMTIQNTSENLSCHIEPHSNGLGTKSVLCVSNFDTTIKVYYKKNLQINTKIITLNDYGLLLL